MKQTQTNVEKVNLTFPVGLREKASSLGINCSWEAAQAIKKEIKRKEKRE
jgi:post-segregation antitoxin (ccd killing protein)